MGVNIIIVDNSVEKLDNSAVLRKKVSTNRPNKAKNAVLCNLVNGCTPLSLWRISHLDFQIKKKMGHSSFE